MGDDEYEDELKRRLDESLTPSIPSISISFFKF